MWRSRLPVPRFGVCVLTPKPCLSLSRDFGCVHPSAPTRMLADTALAVHDRGCSLQGPSHGLSDLAVPASGAACPSQWQLASYVIMMTAPAASEWRWMSPSLMSGFQRLILHRHDRTGHAGSGCAHLAWKSRTHGAPSSSSAFVDNRHPCSRGSVTRGAGLSCCSG